MSSPEFGSHKCIAIEASPESYNVLERTVSLNQGRFQWIQKAVFSKSNVKMHFSEGGRHAGRHVIDGSIEKMKVNEPGLFVPAEQVCEIQTITIDDIVDTYFPEHDSFIIKLDVEGAEIESLKGSEKVLNKNCIIIYEDFGGDEKSEVTEYLLKNNFIIYYPDEYGRLTHIIETAQLNAIKTDKRSGYNFLALNKNGFFPEKMQQMSR
jgi:FkbM family methyltransferase